MADVRNSSAADVLPVDVQPPVLTEELTEQLVKAKQLKEVYEMLKTQSKEQISSLSSTFVPGVCSLFTEQFARDDPDGCVYAEKLLSLALGACDQREFLCLLCDELRAPPSSDIKFRALLKPIKLYIERMKTRKGHSLALALDAINAFVSSLPLPAEHGLEGEERILLDSDENVERATFVVADLLAFLSTFVAEVSWFDPCATSKRASARKQIDELTRCLLRTLAHPLAYLDLTVVARNDGEVSKSMSRVCAETSVELLSQLQPDFVKTLASFVEENKTRELSTVASLLSPPIDVLNVVPDLGLATFSYLILADGAHVSARNCVPLVYTSRFLFEANLPFVLALLQKADRSLVVHKGLLLCAGIMRCIAQREYASDFLESSDARELVRCLVYVAASTKLKEFSELALRLLASLVKVFDNEGRNRLLHFLLKMSPQVGVIGHVVLMLREEIFDNLDRPSSKSTPSKSFSGSDLARLLMVVYALPKGEKSDLLDHSERIMAALNLLRAIVTRDTMSENATGIWDLVPMIEKKYFAVLRAGINLSRSHYQLEIGKVRDGQKLERAEMTHKGGVGKGLRKSGEVGKVAKDSKGGSDGGVDLSWKQQIGVLEMAVETFDMMEVILNNLSELINRQKKEGKDAKEPGDGDVISQNVVES